MELNANMLSDKYNSKKAGNLDWQFNALAGFTFRFGKNHKKAAHGGGRSTPRPATPAPDYPRPLPSRRKPAVQEPAPAAGSGGAGRRASRPHCVRTSSSGSARRSSAPPNRPRSAALAEYLKANPSAADVEILG